MSGDIRYPRAFALTVAERLMAALAPFVERVEVAGSIRRMKDGVGDVELVFIPKLETRQVDMFSTEPADLVHERLNDLLYSKVLCKRPSKIGVFTWGMLNKLAIDAETGIPCDFFCEPNIADWHRTMIIRTGPRELNIKLIQSAAARGLHVHAYSGAGITDATGKSIPYKDEAEFFALCGVPYIKPEDRK